MALNVQNDRGCLPYPAPQSHILDIVNDITNVAEPNRPVYVSGNFAEREGGAIKINPGAVVKGWDLIVDGNRSYGKLFDAFAREAEGQAIIVEADSGAMTRVFEATYTEVPL